MRVLLTGASGYLGRYLLRELAATGWHVDAWSSSQQLDPGGHTLVPVNLTDSARVRQSFRESRPQAVVHSAALASVAACRQQPDLARAINVGGTALLAQLAAASSARFIQISTDMVFDGVRGNYREDDEPAPITVYGQTKRAAEQAVLSHPNSLVLRISLLFGPSLGQRVSFFDQLVGALRQGGAFPLFADEWRTPLSCPTAARAVRELVRSNVAGILHVGGPQRLSRLEMGRRLANHLHVASDSLVAARRDQHQGAEPRPRDLSLDSSKWRALCPDLPWPGFEEALAELAACPGNPLLYHNR